MILLESQLCPLELSKQIVKLGDNNDSYFNWVHPRIDSECNVNETTYIITTYYTVLERKSYPAYSLEEILNILPEAFILGRLTEGWYCKPYSDSYAEVKFYDTGVEACAHAYIRVLKESVDNPNHKVKMINKILATIASMPLTGGFKDQPQTIGTEKMRKITVKFDLEEHPPKDYLTSAQLYRIMTAAVKEIEKRYDELLVTDIDITILPNE